MSHNSLDLYPIWTELLEKYYMEVIIKVNIFGYCWMDIHEQSRALMSSHECSWALVGTQEHLIVCCHGAISVLECSWGLWALMSINEHGAMLLWALMSPHGAMTQYSWVLKSVLECLRVLRHGHWGSGVLLNNPESSGILQCLIRQEPENVLKWPSCSILPKYQSRLEQIIKK